MQLLPQYAAYDLIFADQPFNIDQDYSGYDDNVEWTKFAGWTRSWVETAWNCLTDHGVLALHANDDVTDLFLEIMRNRRDHRISWINWHYRFGQNGKHNFVDSRCHLLVYAKAGCCPNVDYVWNPFDVMVTSDRSSKYNDRRANPDCEEFEGGGERLPLTVWGIPSDGLYWGRVQGNNAERVPECPNQLPEVYLERIIRAYTKKDSVVCDPFCGSGTTAVVAQALGRECFTFDVSSKCVNDARRRLKRGSVRVK